MSKQKKTKKKRDWLKIKLEYQTTDISTRFIAEKYNIPYATVKTRCSKEKWAKGKEKIATEVDAQVTQKTIEAVVRDKVAINERHVSLCNETLDVVEFLLKQYKDEIPKIQSGQLKRGKATPYALDFMMSAILKAQKAQRLALNIDAEDTEDTEPEVKIIEGVDFGKV